MQHLPGTASYDEYGELMTFRLALAIHWHNTVCSLIGDVLRKSLHQQCAQCLQCTADTPWAVQCSVTHYRSERRRHHTHASHAQTRQQIPPSDVSSAFDGVSTEETASDRESVLLMTRRLKVVTLREGRRHRSRRCVLCTRHTAAQRHSCSLVRDGAAGRLK